MMGGAIIIGIVFMIISYAVSARLKNKFKKYSETPISSGLSGAEVADAMLRDNRIYDVKVMSVPGKLSDHYNPSDRTINLSEEVYHGRNAAAAAVAAHETGHAIQHAQAYSFLEFRSALVPVQAVSAKVMNIVVMVSIFGGAFLFQSFPYDLVILLIIGCYGIFTLFSFVTLPVEYDATKRGLAWIKSSNVVNSREHKMAEDALKWAARTYLVAAIGALATLLYYISIFLGRND